MRAAFVLLDGEVTGGQIVALELMQGLIDAGHEALAFLPVDGPIAGRLAAAGIETSVQPLSRSYRLDQAIELGRSLRRGGADLLVTHTLYVGNQLAGAASRLARIPLVAHNHIDERYHPRRLVSQLQRVAQRLVEPTVTIAVSNYLADLLVRNGGDPDRIVVVHNGVRLGEDTPPPDRDGLRLLCIARLAPVKGQEVLLEALRRVPGDVRVDFAGADLEQDGAYRRRLEALAAELGVQDRVRFLGHRDDLTDLLRGSGGLVLPSFAEGLPLVVLEAMAQARAVIATTAGGTPEAAVDGETGILVPPGDPELLAAAIERLAREPGLREAYGRAGYRRIAAHFTTERMVERTLTVYRDIRDVHGAPGRSARGRARERP